jgi:error-prone DNA polymerase
MLAVFGHDVKLIAPEAVRPFVKKGKKNDAADAAAICEAASRPGVRFVPIKSVEQQAVLALHSARSLLVKQQTMLANAMRGLAAEFGLTVPKSMRKLGELMTLVDCDEAVPASARRTLRAMFDQCCALDESIETF